MSSKNSDIHSQSKKIIYSVYSFLKKLSEKEDLNASFFKKTQEITAEACGISKRSIRRICVEARKNVGTSEVSGATGPSFVSPRKCYKRAKYVTEMDDFDSDIVRRTVHEFYDKAEYPTAQLVLNSVNKKTNYSGCLRSMQRLLKSLKFSYKKCSDGRKFLVERNDVVSLRCKFLRKICTLRENNDTRPIVYLDETLVDHNHSAGVVTWQNVKDSVGLKTLTSRGERFIVVHAGCAKHGFIKNSKFVFRINTSNSTDTRMNSDVFKSWFITMLNNLEERSVIVMDNASHHSTLVDNFPKCNTKKSDVQDWLIKKNVKFSPLETLAELRQRVKLLIPFEKKYELDELALQMGHEVIRLPPYHYRYNPIKLIWAQIENQRTMKNNSYNMVDMEQLIHKALDSVTQSDWENCVKYAESVQDKDNEKEILRDGLLEPIMLTLLPDNSDWDSSDYDEEFMTNDYSYI